MFDIPERYKHMLPYIQERLEKIPGVGPARAKVLARNALHSIRDVAQMDPSTTEVGNIPASELRKIVGSAREMMGLGTVDEKLEQIRRIEQFLRNTDEEKLYKIENELTETDEYIKKRRESFTGKPTQTHIITELANEFLRDKIVPFIGAGFSKNVNSDIPIGKTLADLLGQELGPSSEQWSEWDPLRIAELFVHRYGKRRLMEILEQKLNASDKEIAASNAHTHLATLHPSRIYTTNFDCFLERTLRNTPILSERIASIHELAHAIRGRTQVVKLHGTLPSGPSDRVDPENLIISESDYYQRIRQGHPFEELLVTDIAERSLMFIGYSLSDPNISYIWNYLSELPEWAYVKQSYFVLHEREPYDPALAEYLASKKIMVISLRHEGWNLEDFLGEIAARVAGLRSQQTTPRILHRSALSEKEPVFLTEEEVKRLEQAVDSGVNEKTEQALRAAFYSVPTRPHFNRWSHALHEILRSNFSNEAREETLDRMNEQIEVVTKEIKGYENFWRDATEAYVSDIVESVFDANLRLKADTIISMASEMNAYRYFHELFEQLHTGRTVSSADVETVVSLLERLPHYLPWGPGLLKGNSGVVEQLAEQFPGYKLRLSKLHYGQ